MQKGYNVVLCDVDILFLRNPFPFFDYTLDIQGGAHKGVKITGGFIFFRATEASKALWMKVLSMVSHLFFSHLCSFKLASQRLVLVKIAAP